MNRNHAHLGWLFCLVQLWGIASSSAEGQSLARFDAPALLAATEVPCSESADGHDRILEIVVPVSTWLDGRQRQLVSEFQFDVRWLSEPLLVVDYHPRTMMQSEVSGLINIEQHSEDGGRLQTSVVAPLKPVTLQSQLDLTKKSAVTSRAAIVPRQELLVASGTIQRGTGVFFRFHSSPQTALEGGRELQFTARVPRHWRGGLLLVTCQARAPQKSMWGSADWREETVEFVVPVFLEGDTEARDLARHYVSAERQWRQSMHSHPAKKSDAQAWGEWFNSISVRTECRAAPELSREVREAASELNQARLALLRLSQWPVTESPLAKHQ